MIYWYTTLIIFFSVVFGSNDFSTIPHASKIVSTFPISFCTPKMNSMKPALLLSVLSTTLIGTKKAFAMENSICRTPGDFQKVLIPRINGANILLNGKIVEYKGDVKIVTSPILNTITHERLVIGKMAQMTKNDAIAAIESSKSAWNNGQGAWPQLSSRQRIKAILKVVEALKLKREEIVNCIMWEICKIETDAYSEFDRTIQYIETVIEVYRQMTSSQYVSINGIFSLVKNSPIGIMLCLGPYNYPLNETYETLIPALLLGNVAILKLPSVGGLLHVLTMEAFVEYLPAGVINFVSGSGKTVINPIMATGFVDILAFIGSSQAANLIIKEHPFPQRLTIYIGGEAKNPAFVFKDADLNATVREVSLGSLSFNGQRCTALKIVFVHRNIRSEFLRQFVNQIESLQPGLPWMEGVSITPLPEGTKKIEYLQGLLSDSISKGARILNKGGGTVVCGNIMIPAVVYPVNRSMRLWDEEQFGPIVPVAEYGSETELKNYVANSQYGQQASIFTRSPKDMATLLDVLSTSVGRININSQCSRSPDLIPFSGRRVSALGTMSATESLRAFSIPTVIATKDTGTNRELIRQGESYSNFMDMS